MPTLRLMKTGYGDKRLIEWNEKVNTNHTDVVEMFRNEMAVGGRLAFRITSPGEHNPITELDPEQEGDVLIVPAIQGG